MKLYDRIMTILFQTFCKLFISTFFSLFYRLRYINSHNIPKKGGYFIASNHTSFFDPPVIGTGAYYRIFRFMARDTLFKSFFGFGIKWMGAFPVKRGAIDRQAWDHVVNLVKEGWIVMLFPEGTRTPDGEIHEGKAGPGMFIYRTKAQVIPVATLGMFEIWPKGQKLPKLFRRIDVIYGEPVDFSEFFSLEEGKETYMKITEKLMARIRELRQELIDRRAAEKK